MAGFVICSEIDKVILLDITGQKHVGLRGLWSEPSPHLQLVEAECEVQDLSELLGQGLLPLQVLHGRVRRAGQRLQQAAQGVLCRKHGWTSAMCQHRLQSACQQRWHRCVYLLELKLL